MLSYNDDYYEEEELIKNLGNLNWLEEFKDEIKITESGKLKRELLSQINVNILFINQQNELIRTEHDILPLEIHEHVSIASPDKIRDFINKYLSSTESTKYLVDDILLLAYHMVELRNIMSYDPTLATKENVSHLLKKKSIIEDLIIIPSLPIFHKFTQLYIILQEVKIPKKSALSTTRRISTDEQQQEDTTAITKRNVHFDDALNTIRYYTPRRHRTEINKTRRAN